MIRLTLRKKLLVLALVLAVLPLLVAGWTMIRITRDELKSVANDQLLNTARQISREINGLYENTWLAPLLVLRSALDSQDLGVKEKVALLSAGIMEIPDIVALQVSVEGLPSTILVTQDEFSQRLRGGNLEPADYLRLPPESLAAYQGRSGHFNAGLDPIPLTGDWLTTLVLPLNRSLLERNAVLSARIDLFRLKDYLARHPFNDKGSVSVVDETGHTLLRRSPTDLSGLPLVRQAMDLLEGRSRPVSVQPYRGPEGQAMLGAYAFPRYFDWAIITGMKKADAYLAVARMVRGLLGWVLVGALIAVTGAVLLALRISRPILKIAAVATQVGAGNLRARVQGVNSRDEIGELARGFNRMIDGLIERFQLQKFVSGSTVSAIQAAAGRGVRFGGERRELTVFFSDIRGFTAFSETVAPDVVIHMLNTYLSRQAGIVRQYGGDIDKYVGDELMAVFQGPEGIRNAALCALAIQESMQGLNREHPQWDLGIGIGISTGEVVMGAMGSEERMDYTILGDTVNLGARLCGKAARHRILISQAVHAQLRDSRDLEAVALEPLRVKGKRRPVIIYELRRGGGAAG